jgi:hypothetical protein
LDGYLTLSSFTARASSYYVRGLCALYVASCLLLYFVAESPAGTRGIRFIAVYLLLTALMGSTW